MSINNPEVQVIVDRDVNAIIKVIGAFNATTSSNTTIIQANTLAFANSSKPCIIHLLSVDGVVNMPATGYLQFYYVAPTANVGIINLGGAAGFGGIEGFMFNPAGPAGIPANSAMMVANSGDIGLCVVNATAGSSYSLILKIRKDQGYSNANMLYN